MSYKKSVKYYFIISIICIGLLPLINSILLISQQKPSKLISNITIEKFFNTDPLESLLNYTAYKKFNKSLIQNKVIIGKENFLFLGNEYSKVIDKTKGTFRPSKIEINNWANKLLDLQQWYEDKGIKFIIIIAPNKHSIYKEKLPNWLHNDGKIITDDIVEISKQKKINILDLRQKIINRKEDNTLYWKTDTHWTPKGASYAFEETILYLNYKYNLNIEIPKYSLIPSKRQSGDLANFLKISKLLDKKLEVDYLYKFQTDYDICKGQINRETTKLEDCIKTDNPKISTINSPQYIINKSVKNNKLILLCDSFGTAQSQLYNASFNTIWRWHFDHIDEKKLLKFIQDKTPDIIIYQIIERNLYNNKIVAQFPK